MGKFKFVDSWLTKVDGESCSVSDWDRKKTNKNAYYLVCETEFSFEKGCCTFTQHASVKNHIRNFQIKFGKNQLLLILPILYSFAFIIQRVFKNNVSN